MQSKPYVLFLGLIVVLLSFGFYKGNETLDINIHDTYFIISWEHLMILISIIYGLLALVYFSILKLNFRLINWMTVFHVLTSIIALISIFILPKLLKESASGDMASFVNDMSFNRRIEWGILISIFALLCAQLLFFANVISALVKGR